MNTSLHNPHDIFVRRVLADLNVTRNLLQHELPPEVVALLDLSTIERLNGSYVSRKLKSSFSDMVFRVQFRDSPRQAYIYTLFEHKSTSDDWCSLQLLKYMASQWEEFHNQSPREKLPPIIPLVLYHGEEGWRRRDLVDLLNMPTPEVMRPYTPQFDYVLWDVAKMDRQRLEFNLEVRAFLEILHHIRKSSLADTLPQITVMLYRAGHDHQTTLEKIETYLHYAIYCSDHVDEKTIEISLEASNSREELMPTLAQKWIEQGEARGEARGKALGEAQGEARGEARGQARTLSSLITRRFGAVPPYVRQRIAEASSEELDRFATNIFDAESAEAVVELE